jgi:hypothetical protein
MAQAGQAGSQTTRLGSNAQSFSEQVVGRYEVLRITDFQGIGWEWQGSTHAEASLILREESGRGQELSEVT